MTTPSMFIKKPFKSKQCIIAGITVTRLSRFIRADNIYPNQQNDKKISDREGRGKPFALLLT